MTFDWSRSTHVVKRASLSTDLQVADSPYAAVDCQTFLQFPPIERRGLLKALGSKKDDNWLLPNQIRHFRWCAATSTRSGTEYAARVLAITLKRRVEREHGLHSCFLRSVGL